MPHFDLPHQHSSQCRSEMLHTELLQLHRFNTASELFKLFSDATRVRIFWLLSHQEECVINIAALLDMSSPAISHHLRSLTDSGLIVSRRDGKEVFYRAADTEKSLLLHKMLEQVMEISCPEQTGSSQATPEEIVHDVHMYLMEHLDKRIPIEELSRKFLINATTLKQTFKKVYGTSLAAHMKAHRMEKAAKLLRETNDSVASIAKSVGYESQSRFTTAFQDIYQTLPTAYRRQSQDRK